MKNLLLIMTTLFVVSCSNNSTWVYSKFRAEMGTTDLVWLSGEKVWIGRDKDGNVWELYWSANSGKMVKTLLFPAKP